MFTKRLFLTLVLTAGFSVLAATCFSANGAAAQEKKSAEQYAAAAAEEAKAVYEGSMKATQAVPPLTVDWEKFHRWSVRWAEAAGTLPGKRTMAYEDHLKRMQGLSEVMTKLVKKGEEPKYVESMGKYFVADAQKRLAEIQR